MNKVRIGFVGVGSMGQMAHLRNYVDLDDCELVAIAELRQETASLVAARYGVLKVYRDHEEMLAAEELDGIVAAHPYVRHAFLLPALYEGARHVFTEKPLAVSVEAGEGLATAAAQAGCTHMVGYHKRSDPATMAAKKAIDDWKASGKMGKMTYVRIAMPPGDWIAEGFRGLLNAGDAPPEGLQAEGKPEGMSDEVFRQYNSFVNYYIHQVNLMRHLLGEPYEVTHADSNGRLVIVETDSGVTGAIEMAAYHTSIAWEETALTCFEQGYVKLDLPAPLAHNRAGTLEVYTDEQDGQPPRHTRPHLPWKHAMLQQAENFLKVCRGRMPPPCDAAEAVEDLKAARDYIRLRTGQH
jgi:predicted dehydrogenase